MIRFLFYLGEFDVIKELLEKLPESKDGKTKIDRYPSVLQDIYIFLKIIFYTICSSVRCQSFMFYVTFIKIYQHIVR